MLKLNRLNSKGVECETLIDTNAIVGVAEKKHAPTNLYNELGDLVETRDSESTYIIFLTQGKVVITKETYDKLVAKLNVETL